MRHSNVLGIVSRVVCGIGLLLIAGALPWLSRRDPAASILRARYAELEPTPEVLESIRVELGLDGGPIPTSLRWWNGILHGDFGTSWVSGADIGPGVWKALLVSASLTTFAIVVTLAIAAALVTPAARRVLRDEPQRGSGPVGVALTGLPLAHVGPAGMQVGQITLHRPAQGAIQGLPAVDIEGPGLRRGEPTLQPVGPIIAGRQAIGRGPEEKGHRLPGHTARAPVDKPRQPLVLGTDRAGPAPAP